MLAPAVSATRRQASASDLICSASEGDVRQAGQVAGGAGGAVEREAGIRTDRDRVARPNPQRSMHLATPVSLGLTP